MSLELSSEIKMVVSDFDGVFTDGSIYISESSKVQKRLSFKDIMGVSILLKKGIKFGIVSGEDSNILKYFTDKFGMVDIYGGIRQKGIVLSELMEKYNLKSSEVLYIGDDINDIAAFELVKYKVAPKNLNPVLNFKVQNLQITDSFGGNGAIREIADKLAELVESENNEQ